MSESKMNDIIKSSLEGIKEISTVERTVGEPIITPSGVTVIPISKVSVMFLTGGADFGKKTEEPNKSFGAGEAAGISVTPAAFLTIGKNGETNLISLEEDNLGTLGRIISVIEEAPEIISKIKEFMS